MPDETPLADDERRGSRSSVPDVEAEPGHHDEPDADVAPDRMPEVSIEPGPAGSLAELRLRIENLLQRREAASPEAWAELGDDGRTLMVEMLQDWSVRSKTSLYHRLISTLGELQVAGSVARLGSILREGDETELTQAYAANALGRIGQRDAVEALATSLEPAGAGKASRDMVRRQIAIALGRIDDDAVVPSLLQLRDDPSPAVSEVAAAAVERWEQRLDTRLGRCRAAPRSGGSARARTSERKIRPETEVDDNR